jgi:O-succinylbenzoic acid--CoA ligase
MATPLDDWQARLQDNWLIGMGDRPGAEQFTERFNQRVHELTALTPQGDYPRILLAESEPVHFLAGFMAACTTQCPVFLGNPHWADIEWQQVISLTQPDRIWTSVPLRDPRINDGPTDSQGLSGVGCLSLSTSFCTSLTRSALSDDPVGQQHTTATPGHIMIPTGGSSGQIRFVIHTWNTLMASVYGFQRYFQVESIDSCCVLPLYHVSGLMQAMRCLVTGGKLAILPFKVLESGLSLPFDPSTFFLSLVPTQLQRLLQCMNATHPLAQFKTVLLGGAPAWDELLEAARHQQIRLAPTYGMTETASQVATLKPQEFLAGSTGVGPPLPHGSIQIYDHQGMPVASHQVGQVVLQAESLALGYYGDRPFDPVFYTDDMGYLDERGNLHLVGRRSRKIITGGENVFPDEVEAAIRATGLVADVAVIGMGDRHWGEVVMALYVPSDPAFTPAHLTNVLTGKLSRFKHPKHWLAVDSLPRNAQGKLDYSHLHQLASHQLKIGNELKG